MAGNRLDGLEAWGRAPASAVPRLFIVTFAALALYLSPPAPIVATATSWGGTDLAYCLTMISGWWEGEIGDPYLYSDQYRAFGARYAVTPEKIMPMAWSPTGLLTLVPLLEMFALDPRTAEWFWNCGSVFALAGAGLYFLKDRHVAAILIAAAMMSPPAFRSLEFAQTSVGGTGLLLLLLITGGRENRLGAGRPALHASILLLLSLKPTYMVLGLLIVAGLGEWRSLIWGVLLTIFVGSSALLLLPPDGFYNWWTNFSFYTDPADPRYQSVGTVYANQRSAVVRVLFEFWTGASQYQSAKIVYAVTAVCIAAVIMFITWFPRSKNSRSGLIAAVLTGGWAITLIPYLGFHDELLILVPVCATFLLGSSRTRLPGIVVAALTLFHLFNASLDHPILTLASKFVVLAGLGALLLESSESPHTAQLAPV